MIFLGVLLSIVLISAVYLVCAPVYIEIDSTRSVYRIRLHRLFILNFLVNGNPLLLEIKVGFWKKRIDLARAPQHPEPAPVKKKKRTPGSFSTRKALAVLKSFRVNRLEATFDLGDMQCNGIFYPLCCWFSYITGAEVCINFEGKNSLVLQVENNIARMSRAYICS